MSNLKTMAPKRKDKDSETIVKQKSDPITADIEIFLQAFESKYLQYQSDWTKKRMQTEATSEIN